MKEERAVGEAVLEGKGGVLRKRGKTCGVSNGGYWVKGGKECAEGSVGGSKQVGFRG